MTNLYSCWNVDFNYILNYNYLTLKKKKKKKEANFKRFNHKKDKKKN